MGVYPDGSSKRLEKHTVQTRTGGSDLVAGFAVNKAKTKILIEGARANVRFDNARPIALVVRVKDNAADPMSIVRIFRMKPAKKRRTAVIAAAGTFHVTSNDMDYLSFSARKYGESSYYLTLDESPVGEYGITVSNPNNIDEKMVIVSTFRISGGPSFKNPLPSYQPGEPTAPTLHQRAGGRSFYITPPAVRYKYPPPPAQNGRSSTSAAAPPPNEPPSAGMSDGSGASVIETGGCCCLGCTRQARMSVYQRPLYSRDSMLTETV